MESTVEASQSGGLPRKKPALPPKPSLAPKPFSLQNNSTIRSFSAPKAAPKAATTPKSQKPQAQKPETKSQPSTAVTTPAKKLPQPTSASAPIAPSAKVPPKSKPEETKTSAAPPQKENGLGSETGALNPDTKAAPPKEEPKSPTVQKDSVIQTNHQKPKGAVAANVEKNNGEEPQSDTPVSFDQKMVETSNNSSGANSPVCQQGSTRKRLPKELTSKFESGGVPKPPQPMKAIPKPIAKDEPYKPESSETQHSQTTPEPPVRESDPDAPKEDFTGGNSIKKRISLLFESVSKPEVTTKRDEPEIPNGTQVVKKQIKNWVAETGPEDQKVEKKTTPTARARSKR